MDSNKLVHELLPFDNQAPLFQLAVYLLLRPDVFILASFHCILAGTTVISESLLVSKKLLPFVHVLSIL